MWKSTVEIKLLLVEIGVCMEFRKRSGIYCTIEKVKNRESVDADKPFMDSQSLRLSIVMLAETLHLTAYIIVVLCTYNKSIRL